MIARHRSVESQHFRAPADQRRRVAKSRKFFLQDWPDFFLVKESAESQAGYELRHLGGEDRTKRNKNKRRDRQLDPAVRCLPTECLSNLCNRQRTRFQNPDGSTADTVLCYLSANCSRYSHFDNLLHRGTHTAHLCFGPYGLP